MPFSLSTRWNAYRAMTGESLIEEILELGFTAVELGYDLRHSLIPGVSAMVEHGDVRVTSVHNYCPIPMGAPSGHPELFLLGSLLTRERESAVAHTRQTIEFAAEMGAGVVVAHAGRLAMRNISRRLMALAEEGKQYETKYEKLKQKLFLKRERKAQAHIDALCQSLDRLLPVLESSNIRLALENLPSWEAVPNEPEMEELTRRYDTPLIAYWHDIGHGQVRENLGFVGVQQWLRRLQPRLAGMHIHDVIPPAMDHVMPPRGGVAFSSLKSFVNPDMPLVFEPAPGTPAEEVREGLETVAAAWELPAPTKAPKPAAPPPSDHRTHETGRMTTPCAFS